jgi:hypothetical protein
MTGKLDNCFQLGVSRSFGRKDGERLARKQSVSGFAGVPCASADPTIYHVACLHS